MFVLAFKQTVRTRTTEQWLSWILFTIRFGQDYSVLGFGGFAKINRPTNVLALDLILIFYFDWSQAISMPDYKVNLTVFAAPIKNQRQAFNPTLRSVMPNASLIS